MGKNSIFIEKLSNGFITTTRGDTYLSWELKQVYKDDELIELLRVVCLVMGFDPDDVLSSEGG